MTRPAIFADHAIAYGATLLVVGVLDAIWLGFVALSFYQAEIGSVMASPIRPVPALLFYLLYPLGVIYLLWHMRPASLGQAALRGAALGLLAYGTYDLTNLATLQAWTLKVAVVDTLWGLFISASAASAAYVVWRRRGVAQ